MLLKPSHLIAISALVLLGSRSSASAKVDRTVSVTGTATTQAIPDMVVWQLTTTSTHANLVTAKRDSDRKIQAVLATARSLGVAPKDMQTGYLAIQRMYQHGKFTSRRSLKNFRVSRELTITQRDINRFDEVLTKLIEASEMEVHYALESSKLTSLRDKTRLDAVLAARTKAAAMAGALGTKLGPVLTITEDSFQGGYPKPHSNTVNWNEYESRSRSIPQDPSSFAPGTIDVTVSVSTVFELR